MARKRKDNISEVTFSYVGTDEQFDEFLKMLVHDYPDEETQMQAHTAFADDRRNLRIETTDGLRFFISFHPSFDWINGGGTMSYFKIDEQMHAWIDRNLN